MKLLNKKDIIQADNRYAQYRIPGIISTESGVIICYFECRMNNASDWSVSDIGMKRSLDGGATWEPIQIIATGHGKNVSNNPIMIADGNIVHFIWQENYKRAFHSKSLDDGVTWSEPIEITDAFEETRPKYPWTIIATGPGHGIKLSSGRLVVPLWLASNPSAIFAHAPSVVSTLYSDDNGNTWKMGEIISNSMVKNPNESDLAELSDGSIIINIRNEAECHLRCVARSYDGGKSFNDIKFDENLIDPICDAGLIAHDTVLYFSNCESTSGRVDLTLKCSTDNGKNWSKGLHIENIGGYSDLTYNKKTDSIFVFYECENSILRIAEIMR